MTPDSDVLATLQRFYDAETAYILSPSKDFSVIAAVLHPNCLILQPDSLPYGGRWEGHAGFEAWMQAFDQVWSSLEVTEPRFFVSEPRVVFVRSTVRAVTRAGGEKLSWPLLQMITVEDGLIREIQPFYWDTAPVVAGLARTEHN